MKKEIKSIEKQRIKQKKKMRKEWGKRMREINNKTIRETKKATEIHRKGKWKEETRWKYIPFWKSVKWVVLFDRSTARSSGNPTVKARKNGGSGRGTRPDFSHEWLSRIRPLVEDSGYSALASPAVSPSVLGKKVGAAAVSNSSFSSHFVFVLFSVSIFGCRKSVSKGFPHCWTRSSPDSWWDVQKGSSFLILLAFADMFAKWQPCTHVIVCYRFIMKHLA